MKPFTNFLGEFRIDQSLRQKLNAEFSRNRITSGNQKVQSVSDGLRELRKVLEKFNGDIIATSMDLFLGSDGVRRLDYSIHNEDVDNSVISFSWHKEHTGYEIVCYAS